MSPTHDITLTRGEGFPRSFLPGPEPPEDLQAVSSQYTPLAIACAIAGLAALGLLGLYPTFLHLWRLWMNDPLRSLGILLLPVSFALILHAWRRLGWEQRGTWWGLLPLALAFLGSLLLYKNVILVVNLGAAHSTVSLFPACLPAYLYGSGVVLLFGGVRVWRRAWFPLLLLLLLNPVPTTFVSLIDTPLQYAAAHVARSFATSIGFVPTTPQLRLMFSPRFGMFIAPGCDGIRGAVTMGYLVLILGYLKRLSLVRWSLYATGAVLLGYVFNFVRLCCLVLYYRAALGHHAWEKVAKQADYAIGGCLFLLAVVLLVHLLIQKLPHTNTETPVASSALSSLERQGLMCKCAALSLLMVAPVLLCARALAREAHETNASSALVERMPEHIGNYRLVRTWHEQSGGGTAMEDGAYAEPGSPNEIILGFWRGLGSHDSNDCWLMRGATPKILASAAFPTAGGYPVTFDTGFFNDGMTDSVLWNANCSPDSCAEMHDTGYGTHVELRFVKPDGSNLTSKQGGPVSILIKIEQPHNNDPAEVTYKKLSARTQHFVAAIDFHQLSRQFQ